MDDLTGLIAFLRARYDEREQEAREAAGGRSGEWRAERTASGTHKVIDDLGYSVVEHADVDSEPWFTTPHIAANDPAYVLADIAAKRRILDLAVPVDDPYDDEQVWYQQAITDVIRHMALPDVRAALDAHLNEHGCGTGDHRSPNYVGGFGNCPTARALWDLLPPSDQVLNA